MTLNVKDPEAHRLADAIARETGETLTRAVTEALRERYERLQHRRSKATVGELIAGGGRGSAAGDGGGGGGGGGLYDERGLPK